MKRRGQWIGHSDIFEPAYRLRGRHEVPAVAAEAAALLAALVAAAGRDQAR